MSAAPGSRSLAVQHGGVFLASEIALPLWLFIQGAIRRQERDGASVRPEVREALEALRIAAQTQANVHSSGHVERTLSAARPQSLLSLVSTTDFARNLGVGPRQARRIARQSSVLPASRGRWRRADVEMLIAIRTKGNDQ